MLIREMCRIGYFDRIFIDGFMMPLYNNDGIEILEDSTLLDCVKENSSDLDQGIARLKINIVGESFLTSDYTQSEINRMRKHRERDMKLIRYNYGKSDRYCIGYVDIYIVKGDSLIPDSACLNNKSLDSISKLSKNEAELNTLNKAIEVQRKLIKENEDIDEINIGIVDKVYVDENFRRCKISSWIHTNMQDIIKMLGLVDVAGVILMPGDFSREAKNKFGMTNDEYVAMLHKHYKKMGYKDVTDGFMYRQFISKKRFFGIK